MVLHHLIGCKNQVGTLSDLHRLIGSEDLPGRLRAFLLVCKVDGLSPRTLKDYSYKIGSFVSFCADLGINNPKEVSTSDVRMFLLKLQERNGAVSVGGYYKCAKRFFNWMVEEGLLDYSPVDKIRSPRIPQKFITPFRPEHIKRLLSLCDDKTFLGVRNRAIILTFLDTGLRLSELAGIQLNDVDFDREVIMVMGKGAKQRVVRIGRITQKVLLRYLTMRDDDHPCLWVSQERRPLTAWGIAVVMRSLKRRAGIEGVRCSAHTFRHTFATQALLNGAGEFEVQSLLGHSKLDMTRRYAASLRSEEAVRGHRKFSPVDNMGLKY